MWTLIRVFVGGNWIWFAVAAGLTFSHGYMYVWGHGDGKELVLNKLASDRVKIYQDGKEIDEKVLGADDTALCDMLGGCNVQVTP